MVLTNWLAQSNASSCRPTCIKHRHFPSSISLQTELLLLGISSVQTTHTRHSETETTQFSLDITPTTLAQRTQPPPQSLYSPFSGTIRVSRCQDFMVQGKINRGRHTDNPAGRHSIRTNQCPPSPSPHKEPNKHRKTRLLLTQSSKFVCFCLSW